jgi:hypothetical protein
MRCGVSYLLAPRLYAYNDPVGITLDNNPLNQTRAEGIYYISSRFDAGFRAAKITSLLEEELRKNRNRGKVSFQDMMGFQRSDRNPRRLQWRRWRSDHKASDSIAATIYTLFGILYALLREVDLGNESWTATISSGAQFSSNQGPDRGGPDGGPVLIDTNYTISQLAGLIISYSSTTGIAGIAEKSKTKHPHVPRGFLFLNTQVRNAVNDWRASRPVNIGQMRWLPISSSENRFIVSGCGCRTDGTSWRFTTSMSPIARIYG